ncbi:uncharacterized protein PV09_07844 [Verruconis gallopava]|uniref:RING-type domain-containing protein n=1 Tax=Verruconis gallopava TaxID=253628 RepID=A0A0D1YIH5_9PEZI|nr:uncharacterized protein PV09_07844 [Verruconis gallopava]KIW00657.1 hypothetical protein PV09_07844 [Verruconis gallopava]
MGTLTADCPRLAEHCPHKLPSSCRLTSTPKCCACADERPHSLTYRVYIDGVGFVQRGTRWQSYCWFCKTFWDTRVAAAGLSPSDTKIPEDPDQTEFVERWFEFHQGYRIVVTEDGREERIPLQGEPLKDADPGCLPRTMEELQSGRRNILQSDIRRREQVATIADSTPHVTLENALDQLIEEANEDEEEASLPSGSPIASQSVGSRSHTNETSSGHASRTAQQGRSRLDEAYAEAEAAVEAAQRVRDRAHARLNNADAELAAVRERLRRIRRQQITAGNFARVFGTREDVQSDDYVSPITSMFIRQAQWGRQMAERQRALREQQDAPRSFEDSQRQQQRDDTAAPPNDPQPSQTTVSDVQETPRRGQYIGDSHTFVQSSQSAALSNTNQQANLTQPTRENASDAAWDDYLSRFADYMSPEELVELRIQLSTTFSSPADAIRIASFRPPALQPEAPIFVGLDGDGRPEPKTEDSMRFKLECKICLQQVADTACLPCGHLSMCEWCADQWVPTKEHDKTRPRDKGVRCPCCRAKVKSRVKIYVG